MPQPINFKAKIFLLVSLLLVFNPLHAGSSDALYAVEVLVVDESADTRWRVLKEGLEEVFIRISGDSIIMDKLKRPPASRYVKQYSYEPVVEPTSNELGEILSHRLKVQYNGHSMGKYLRDNGFPVWGEHRTDLVVWLAIRDGSNEYVLKDSDQSLLKTSAGEALHRRGIPERWPLYDYKDRKILKVADIRGGFNQQVAAASKRYGRGSALTGSLTWNGQRWQSSWSLIMTSGNRHWSIEDADYKQLINKAIDQAADAMGIVYAIHGTGKNQQLASIQLDVQAVSSIKKYRKLENYLRDLNAVVTARPLKVDGENASFEVTLRSTEEDFFNLIKNDAKIIESKPIKSADGTPPSAVENLTTNADVSSVNKKTDGVNSNTATENATVESTAVKSKETINSLDQPLTDASDENISQSPVYYYKLLR